MKRVFGPIVVTSFTKLSAPHTAFTVLKHFGTGAIISTTFVDLYTHASLMLGNECLGELGYESIYVFHLMAGISLSFLADYLTQRFLQPIGMALGIGVLSKFTGNDPPTIIAIGPLEASAAGILVWVGSVEMWAADWVLDELRDFYTVKTVLSLIGLVLGMIIMIVLDKWA
jgi:hypothetical protein